MSPKHNEPLVKAVQYLYGKGIIRKDKDISDKTEYNKASVSSYLSGNLKASESFIRKFEQVFNLSLKDFEEGGSLDTIRHPDVMQLLSETILQLKAETQTNRQLLVEVLAAVTNRPVTEVQMMAERFLSHNLAKILSELKQDAA